MTRIFCLPSGRENSAVFGSSEAEDGTTAGTDADGELVGDGVTGEKERAGHETPQPCRIDRG